MPTHWVQLRTLCVCQQGEEKAWLGQSDMQPLAKYTLRNPKPLATKTLVFPGAVYQFFVHDGKFRTNGNSVDVDGERCAYVAHMRCVAGVVVHRSCCVRGRGGDVTLAPTATWCTSGCLTCSRL